MDSNKEINWLLKEKYHGQATSEFEKDVERLKKGEPLDYVIGFAQFLGSKIDVSKKPLIPRPETEFWVGEVLKNLERNNLTILDIFSGSGCIGISVLQHVNKSKVTFAEKDKKCIQQIQINCKLNNISKETYRIVESDVFENVKGKFNYIFANPPYISLNKQHKVQTSVLKYEPKAALFGGSDGLKYIRRFLKGAKEFLEEGGKIYMEFDSVQKTPIEKLVKQYGYKSADFQKDQYGKWRYVVIQ